MNQRQESPAAKTLTHENDKMLESLQQETFEYFLHEDNPANGLVADKTRAGWPASIAAVGLALAAYPVGVEHDFCSRNNAMKKTLTALRFFRNSPQGTEADATGYKGFYYHFLDMKTGRRAWNCELSTVDSAFLLAGMLTAAAYFDRDSEAEQEIRRLADELYQRADWQWAQNGGATLTHGWKPESGFLPFRWEGYDEATATLYPRIRFAVTPAAGRELCGMGFHLRMEKDLRYGIPLCRAALHSSTFSSLDRFSRHPGRIHASTQPGLFREQSPSDVYTTAVCDSQSAGIRRLQRELLGLYRQRWARPQDNKD